MIYNKWNEIEKQLLNDLSNNSIPDDIKLVKTKIKKDDEWTVYAHSKTDYSTLCEEDFIKTISDYLIFKAKKDMNILDSTKSEFENLELLSQYYGDKNE